MPVNLSIKNAPDEMVRRLRARAERNHRSLQGELMAIVENAVSEPALTPLALLADIQSLGLRSRAEAVDIVRADRDGR